MPKGTTPTDSSSFALKDGAQQKTITQQDTVAQHDTIAQQDSSLAPQETCLLAQVAVEVAVAGVFSYSVPQNLADTIMVGQSVLVPFGNRKAVGYVISVRLATLPLNPRIKPLSAILSPEPLFGPGLCRLINFVSHYYFYPPGLCAKEILPGGLSPKLEKVATLINSDDLPDILPDIEKELLSRFIQAEEATLPYKMLEAEGLGTILKRWVGEGRLNVGYRLEGGVARLQTEWWLGPAAELPTEMPRLGPKERELWEMVYDGPARPLHYYASFLKNPLLQARGLAAKGLASLTQKEFYRDDPARAISLKEPGPPPLLTPQQTKALAAISASLNSETPGNFLLFGVTGSGKTEVYLRAAEETLAKGKSVLWLIPEIALTMGLEGFLKSRICAEQVSVLHSGLTARQRHDQWLKIKRGLAPLVLGARSAVFAPLENLGLVIVDEEHDGAYKQDDGLRYNGRDLARWRAFESKATLILGSATPSFESYQAALDERLTLLKMTERPKGAMLPEVELIDQGAEPARFRSPLSPILQKQLGALLERGEQALLFINRRGLANLPMCLKCGEALKCPHCSRTLTLHGPEGRGEQFATHGELSKEQILICHSCAYRAEPPKACPACLSPLFRYFGVGTEKLLEMTERIFPTVRGARLDTDSVRLRGGLKSILQKFGRGDYNLLVGTQMAAKGHDFPNLTLVGVVEADLGLNLPDFRASERTFQLLSQVAGRAGRAERPGLVLIQTMTPRHPVLKAAAEHDYEKFFASEITARSELGYPPFTRLALVCLSGPDEKMVEEIANKGGELAASVIDELAIPAGELEILGPLPAPMVKIKDRYRYHILVRSINVHGRQNFLNAWWPILRKTAPKAMRLTLDIDPYHFM